VWALAVAGADAAVIVRGDADRKPVTRSASRSSTTTVAPATVVTAKATTTTIVSVERNTSTPAPAETTTVASSGEVVVAQVSGDGETPASVSFHTSGRWQIRWRVDDAGP
jgi:hypothetical protein